MNNYIRSAQKLMMYSRDIFAVAEPAMDTKAIVLFLAATQPSNKFLHWIEAIAALEPIKAQCKAVNLLQQHLGTLCGKYVLFKILQNIDHDLCSNELQQFISASKVILADEDRHILTVNKLLTPLYERSVNGLTS